MRTGGTAKTLRWIIVWCVVISLLVIFKDKKTSYKKLWKTVGDFEGRITSLEKEKTEVGKAINNIIDMIDTHRHERHLNEKVIHSN